MAEFYGNIEIERNNFGLYKALKTNRPSKPLRQVSNRQIMRNQMKKQIGSNKIKSVWYKAQVKKYGEKGYFLMRLLKKTAGKIFK